MSFSLSIPDGANFVLVCITGRVTREVALESGVAATALGNAKGLCRFLYDLRSAPNTETAASNYYFVYQDMPERGLTRNVRVALLAAPDDHSHDFVETLMLNAGYVVSLFREEQAALEWLAAGPAPRED
jgi:hypothetical protein